MKYYIYESMEDDCHEYFEIETEWANFTWMIYCDDCEKAHPFIQVAEFDTMEELEIWHQLEEEEEDRE